MTGIIDLVSTTRPPAGLARRALFLFIAAVIVAVVGIRLMSASIDRPAAVPVSVTSPSLGGSAGPANGSGCSVSGDLVGDSNPATVAALLCGGH